MTHCRQFVHALALAVTVLAASCTSNGRPQPQGPSTPVVTNKPMATKLAIEVLEGSESSSEPKPDAVLLVVNETERDIVMVQPMIGLDTRIVMADSEVAPWNDSFVQVELTADGWVTIKSHSSMKFDMSFADAYKWALLPDGKFPCYLEYDDTIANRLASKKKLSVFSNAGPLKSPWFYVVTQNRSFVRVERR